MSDCQIWIQSPARTLFETLISIGIVLSYLTQYIVILRTGTFGISSWYILFTSLFSTTQFAGWLSNNWAKFSFVCVNSGELRGLNTLSAILGFIQAAVQWLCAILLAILFLKYRNYSEENPAERQYRGISSPTMKTILVTYNFILILTGLTIVWRPDWVEDHRGREWMSRIFEMLLDFLWACLALALVLVECIPQITTTLKLRTRGSISTATLGLQIVAFILLGIAQALRLGTPPNQQHQPHRTPVELYFKVRKLWVNYLLSALGHFILLVVCLCVDWGHFGWSPVLRL